MAARHRLVGSRSSRRLCLIGPYACGKTCMRLRLSGKPFVHDSQFTIACQSVCVCFPTRERPTDNGITVNVDDTSGEERFRNGVTVNFVRHAQCVLLCFDLSCEGSLTEAQNRWLPWVKDECCSWVKVILIGLKADLKYSVPSEVIVNWAEEKGLDYFETSSKTGHGFPNLEEHIGSFFAHQRRAQGMPISEEGRASCLLDSDRHQTPFALSFCKGEGCSQCGC